MFINFTMNHTVAIIAKLPLTKLKIVPMILVLNCSKKNKRTEIFKCVYYFRLLHKHKIEATGFIPQINQWVFALRFYNNGELALKLILNIKIPLIYDKWFMCS